ncbi:hypothetical protein GCM10028801_36190 [Nocardioides maradonensis]
MTTDWQSLRAAIYVRLSEDKRQTGDNVADQERAARDIAAKHGWTIAGVYDDNDRTAADPERKPRPGFDRLLADAEAGRFDVVICRHADRLYRHPLDQLRLSQTLGPKGITIVQEWAGFPLDLSTPTGVLQSGILAQVSLYELSHKKERQQAANRAHALSGEPPRGGPVPFGYAEDRKTPKEAEATLIRDAHRALLRGETFGSVIRAWNDSGISAPRGGRWSYSTVRAVLSRPMNAGLVFYGGQVHKAVDAKWTALVSPEDHYALVNLLADPARRTTTEGNGRKHLLSGVVCCGTCGQPMSTGTAGSKTSVGTKTTSHLYKCRNATCAQRVNVAREKLNEEVERRFLTERGPLAHYRLIPVAGHDAATLADVEARIAGTTARLSADDADVPALLADLERLKAERRHIREAPAFPRYDSGTVAEEWEKAKSISDPAERLAAQQKLLLDHLAPGGLRISPRGKISHRFDPTRVEIKWVPVPDVDAAPVAYAPDDGTTDFGKIPA